MAGKRRKRMGRPPKPTGQVKSEWVTFAVEPARAAAYESAAKAGFKGVLSDFARAACNALAKELGHPVSSPEKKAAD